MNEKYSKDLQAYSSVVVKMKKREGGGKSRPLCQ